MTGAGPRVVIVGAGIVGAGLADELTERGWTDITVLEAGRLPRAGGSTSHAPGVVFQTNATKVMADFARYTVAKLSGLSWQGEPCYLPVGGVEIATTAERAAELQRRYGFAQSWGVAGARLLDPQETVKAWDLLDPSVVHGGLFVPDDGIAKAIRAVQAQLARAGERGAVVRDRHEVIGVDTAGDRVTGVRVRMPDGEATMPADVVVCCAGIWGPRVAGFVGQTLALTPLAHQFAWTAPVAPLATHAREATRPVLRHQDADLYYREQGTGLGIGSYRHDPMPVAVSELAAWESFGDHHPGQPSVLPFTPADFEFALDETARIMPVLGRPELADPFNGVFSFTTDNLPLLGAHADLDGFFTAEAVWITHSAGVARAMSDLIVDGHSSRFDLHACDVNRFEVHQLAPAYIRATNARNFVEVYDILHPLQPKEHSRPMRTSPFYPRQQELGAVFLEANGWERPQWYAVNDHLLGSDRLAGMSVPHPDSWAGQFFSPTVVAEAAVTRTDVALYDMTALKRLEISGPGATEFLATMVTGKIGSVGAVTYCLLLAADGGIRSDVTVARLEPQRYQIGANGALDLVWLRRALVHSAHRDTVQIRDITAGTCCLGIWGPRARDVVQPLTDTDFSHTGFGYFRAKQGYLGTVAVTALRVSYVGELGWELYTSADQGLALWDLLMTAGAEHGIIAAGRGAFTALRIEKGYRSYGTDMTEEHGPADVGLEFAVKAGLDFHGRDGLDRRPAGPLRLSLLTLAGPDDIVLGGEPVYPPGGHTAVGYVTSAAWSPTLGKPLALAFLPVESDEPGRAVEVGYFDRRYAAVVTAEPAVDPEMRKIRC